MAQGDSFKKLGELFHDAKKRQEFADDPKKAMKDAGIPEGDIPDELLSTLQDMTADQLLVLSRVNKSLDKAQVPPHAQADIV